MSWTAPVKVDETKNAEHKTYTLSSQIQTPVAITRKKICHFFARNFNSCSDTIFLKRFVPEIDAQQLQH